MKKSLIALTFMFSIIFSFAQKQMGEKEALIKSHIDFSKEYLIFTLHGLIEIDGHIFKNDTCKCPITYSADLNGVGIKDTCRNVNYSYKKCELANCKIIHLKEKEGDYKFGRGTKYGTTNPFQYQYDLK